MARTTTAAKATPRKVKEMLAKVDAPRKLTGAAAKAVASKGKASKPAPTPKACGCGCAEMTKGGEFAIGHDAKHKSGLIKTALKREGGLPMTVKAAEAELERRGWTKFLEKSRNVVVRVPSEHKAAKAQDDIEDAQVAIERLDGMKRAVAKVQLAGRSSTIKGARVVVTRDNWRDILNMSNKAIRAMEPNEYELPQRTALSKAVDAKRKGKAAPVEQEDDDTDI
jgi:hypothetical protein